MVAGVAGSGLINLTECLGELACQIAAMPGPGVDLLKTPQMLGKGLMDRGELFKAALRFLGLALHRHDRTGKLVGDIRAPLFQFLLAAGQILKPLLFLFDFLLLLPELEELGLRALDLILKFFCGGGLLQIQQFIVVFVEV